MNRGSTGALFLVIGMALGYVMASHESEKPMMATQTAYAMAQESSIADDIKETKDEVKEINKLLQSGRLVVSLAVNPDNAGR